MADNLITAMTANSSLPNRMLLRVVLPTMLLMLLYRRRTREDGRRKARRNRTRVLPVVVWRCT
jgi:hypothetical protein